MTECSIWDGTCQPDALLAHASPWWRKDSRTSDTALVAVYLVFGLSWEKLFTMCMHTPHRCIWCLCWLFPWSSKTNSCHELGLAYRGDGWSTMLACSICCPFPSGAMVPGFQCFAERFWHMFYHTGIQHPSFARSLMWQRELPSSRISPVHIQPNYSGSIWKMYSKFQGMKR